ncbi:MAG: hypothetical protein AAF846_23370 [Chloroflexota bacterium]
MIDLELSNHAQIQADRRNFSLDDIRFVVRNAHREHATGAIFFQMRAKDMPAHIPPNDRRRDLIGATVLTCSCKRYVITMYKNASAFKKDRAKQKYDNREKIAFCPCCNRHLH